MRGIYLNCEVPAEIEDFGAPELSGHYFTFQCGPHRLHLVGNCDTYYFEKDGYQVFLSGWAFTNRSIRPQELFQFFLENNLNELAAGNFICVVYNQNDETLNVFNDPFALSNHYFCRDESGSIRLSPCLSSFSDQPENKLWSGFHRRQGYVPGNQTQYSTVRRMAPASRIDSEGAHHKYCDPYVLLANGEPGDIGRFIRKLSNSWEESDRYTNCSGDFTSELLRKYTQSKCTAAPLAFVNGGQQKISEMAYRIRKLTGIPIEVEQLQHPLCIANRLSQDAAGVETTMFSDYLWKVLLLPYEVSQSLFRKVIKAKDKDKQQEKLLKELYPGLVSEDRQLLLAEYQRVTDHLQLSQEQKVSYFDALYGRTARYELFLTQVLPNQFYRAIPTFAHRQIFSLLLQEDLSRDNRDRVMERMLL